MITPRLNKELQRLGLLDRVLEIMRSQRTHDETVQADDLDALFVYRWTIEGWEYWMGVERLINIKS